MNQQFNFSFRGTTNANTLEAWKQAGIEIEKRENESVDKKTGKKEITVTFHRPDIAIDVEMPELETLLESEVGLKVLEKLLHGAVEQIIRPLADDNKVSELPEITAEALWKVLQTPVKASALRATPEQMKVAAGAFEGFLEQINKTGKTAALQVEYFASKFSKSKLDKLAANLYTKGADRAKVLEIVQAIETNVSDFLNEVSQQDSEEIIEACTVPTKICLQNIAAWVEETKEAPEASDLLDVESF